MDLIKDIVLNDCSETLRGLFTLFWRSDMAADQAAMREKGEEVLNGATLVGADRNGRAGFGSVFCAWRRRRRQRRLNEKGLKWITSSLREREGEQPLHLVLDRGTCQIVG